MTGKDVLKFMLKSNEHMVNWYVSDLSDADLLVRPTPNANHIAWQLGHLIESEANYFLPKIPGSSAVKLPEGFANQHNKEMSLSKVTTGFLKKDEYLALRKSVRAATFAALDNFPDVDLGKDPQTGLGDMVPTFASVFAIVANHDMMHAGQFTVIRRHLGKPILF
jgi:DinB superfamily